MQIKIFSVFVGLFLILTKRAWLYVLFYNRSGDEYSILFPLAAWNPVNQDGWIVPAYWNLKDDSYGFFPFYLHNRYSDFYLLFFLLRDNDGERAGCGLLPLAYYSRKGGYFAIFWYKNNFRSWGVFPLIWRSPTGSGDILKEPKWKFPNLKKFLKRETRRKKLPGQISGFRNCQCFIAGRLWAKNIAGMAQGVLAFPFAADIMSAKKRNFKYYSSSIGIIGRETGSNRSFFPGATSSGRATILVSVSGIGFGSIR